MNKILRMMLLLLLVAGVFTLLGFVGSLRSVAICEALEVHFPEGNAMLVSELEVRDRAVLDEKMPVGLPLGELDTRSMEEAIADIPHVKEVVVYKTIDRKLVVELKERSPIARLIDRNGRHALLDTDGHILPLSPHGNLRLPVITGQFQLAKSAIEARSSVFDSEEFDALQAIYNYVVALQSDPFWVTQLQHTEYTDQGELIAHPQVGNHNILFGKPDRLAEKLHTLNIFYKEGMNAARWNRYSTINLKYKDQIVCTKK